MFFIADAGVSELLQLMCECAEMCGFSNAVAAYVSHSDRNTISTLLESSWDIRTKLCSGQKNAHTPNRETSKNRHPH